MSSLFKKSTYENIAMSIIWLYSYNYIWCYDYATHVYNTNPKVQFVIDWLLSTITFLGDQYKILTSNKKNEPESDHWFCVCSLPDIDRYYEMYEMIRDTDENKDIGTSEQKHSFAFSFSDLSALDVITILKNANKYNVRFFDPKCNSIELPKDEQLSSFEVMSVSYSHPKMKASINLEINKSMLIVGNQLFSPVFVKRCLEYQEEDFYFDQYLHNSKFGIYASGTRQCFHSSYTNKTQNYLKLISQNRLQAIQ